MRRWRDHRMQRLWSRLVYLGRHEWPLLLSLLLVAGVIWTFAVLADAVIAGGTQAFDRAILLPMRAPEDGVFCISPQKGIFQQFAAEGA